MDAEGCKGENQLQLSAWSVQRPRMDFGVHRLAQTGFFYFMQTPTYFCLFACLFRGFLLHLMKKSSDLTSFPRDEGSQNIKCFDSQWDGDDRRDSLW